MRLSTAVAAVALLAFLSTVAQATNGGDSIPELVIQLDDEEWSVREEATKKIIEKTKEHGRNIQEGEPPILTRDDFTTIHDASGSESAEVRMRIRRIVYEYLATFSTIAEINRLIEVKDVPTEPGRDRDRHPPIRVDRWEGKNKYPQYGYYQDRRACLQLVGR